MTNEDELKNLKISVELHTRLKTWASIRGLKIREAVEEAVEALLGKA